MSKVLDTCRIGGDGMGYKVRNRREQLGMTQDELAQKSGVSRQTISAIETNSGRNTSTKTLQRIASAMETTVGELFFDERV